MATIADLLIGLGFDIDDSGLSRLDRAIGNIKKTLGALAIGEGIRRVLTTFGDFEEELNKAGALADATGAQMEAMKEQALQLGASTKFSASEAAAGMGELASAGLSTADIMAAMPGTLDLAASGAISVAQAAEATGQILGGFGLQASQAGHAADVLAQAAAMSAIGVGHLQDTMKYVAPNAKAAGQSLEEMAALTALMGEAGVKGEQAGTSLRGALLRLVDPPKEAAGQLAKLNVAIADQRGNIRPLRRILDDLRSKTKEMTEAQRLASLSMIFGAEASSGMLAILNTAPEKVGKFADSMANADGAAKHMADRMNKGLNASVRELMGAVETLAIRLGERLAPHVEALAGMVKELTNQFSENKGFLEGFSQALDILKVAAVAAAYAFASFQLAAFAKWVVSATQATWGFVAALNAEKIAAIQAWAATVLGPALIAAGILALILVVQDLITWMQGGEAALGDVFDTGYERGYQFMEWLEGAVENIKAWFASIGDYIGGIINNIVAAIQGITQALAQALPGLGYLAASIALPAAGPRPALVGAGGGSFSATTSITNQVTVPQSYGPAGVTRAVGAVTGQSVEKAVGRVAQQRGRALR